MPHRERFVPNCFYHIYNRGNNRDLITFDKYDSVSFFEKLRHRLSPDLVEYHGYVLLPNHYHLLVRVLRETGIERAMKAFGISYARRINLRHGHVGHVFQGRYRVRRVGTDSYLLNLSRYIHLNPVLAGLVQSPEDWKYSSYRWFLHPRTMPPGSLHVTTDVILAMVGGPECYKLFVEDYLQLVRQAQSGNRFPKLSRER
jgi:putative transposase